MKRNWEILVISDTHGSRLPVWRAMERLTALPDAVLFLGDGLADLSAVTTEPGWEEVPVYSVAGNCDGSLVYLDDVPEVRTLTLGGCRIVMMHGHTFDVKRGNVAALRYAMEQEADVLLYGHTHAPFYEYCRIGDRTMLVGNPGSLGRPLWDRKPTFGMLTIRDGKPLFSYTEL